MNIFGRELSIKKGKVIMFAAIISVAAGFIMIFIGMAFYKNRVAKVNAADLPNYHKYEYHYAIISEEVDPLLWEAIYQGALEKGKENDIYVERIGSDLSVSYSLKDLMKIAIAAKVDGIIIEPNGEEDIIELINMAEEMQIPVVTVLKDAPESTRKSFVGINSYNQGQTYGKQVLEVIGEGKRNITVLLNSDSEDAGQNMIYSGIREMVNGYDVEVEAVKVNTQSTFSSEEDIRNIIRDIKKPTDVLVCLTAVDTLCARQAVVDYNKVGDIDIIGYYDSELILSAIELGIIHSTMTIDAKQMGALCVDALTEYIESGRVSEYFNVDISIINSENIGDYLKKDTQDNG